MQRHLESKPMNPSLFITLQLSIGQYSSRVTLHTVYSIQYNVIIQKVSRQIKSYLNLRVKGNDDVQNERY